MSDLKNSKINASNWNLKWQKDWKKERNSKWKTNAHLKFRPHERGQFGAKFQKAAVETTHQSCSFRNKAIQVFWIPLYNFILKKYVKSVHWKSETWNKEKVNMVLKIEFNLIIQIITKYYLMLFYGILYFQFSMFH